MKLKSLALTGVAIAAVAALAACSTTATGTDTGSGDAGSNDASLTTLRVQVQSAISAESLYLGVEQGFFEDEGLELEMVDVPDTAAGFAALQSGSLDIGFTPMIGLLQAARQNMPLTIVSAADGVHPDALDAAPEDVPNYTSVGIYTSKGSGITDMSGLEGATIAVPILKSQPDATINSVLLEAGYDPSEINWLLLDFVSALAALKDDQIDAAFLVSPFTLEADEAGLARVMNPSVDFFDNGAVSSWVATDSFVDENPETIASFQRAMKKSAAFANANLDLAKEHVIKRIGLELTPSDLPNSYWPETIVVDDVQRMNDKLVAIDFFDTELDVAPFIAPQQ